MVRSQGKSRAKTPTGTTPPPTSVPKPPPDSSIRKKISALRRGNAKTSSIAATSSIVSSSLNQSYPAPSDEHITTHTSHLDRDAIGQESSSHRAVDSVWQTAYSTARMAIDITKESSDLFLPLKAVVGALSVLIRNYDRTVNNTRQIGEIEERVLSLSDILRFPLRENDHSEHRRRELLRKRFTDVLERLEPLSEQHGLLRFLRNEDHAGLLDGFVQDIAQAVTDYQTSLQQSTYENAKDILEVARDTHKISRNTDKTTKGIAENIIEAAEAETLDKLDPVRNAGYRAEHHERCLSGTRESILDNVMRWAQNTQDQPVYWLNGLAGTGKSTIAQTFSEMASNGGILGASFFCSRDYLDRKVLKNIFPTLAYQLACRYPQFRDHLVKVIKRDPSVAHNSLISQLKDLVVDPLSAIGISCIIVIDALDECVDDQPASAILSVLGRLVNKLPLVKFFITGRPEPRIRSGFRLPLLQPFTQVFLLHEVEPTSVGGDIRLYLTTKLSAIAKRRSDLELPEVWPSDEDIAVLVKKSSGLFIFASTVARFIESEHHDPGERLRLIVSRADDTRHEGASGIDSLYSQVLHDAFSGIEDESVFDDLRRILGAVVLAINPLSRDGLVQFLSIDSTVISARLRHLHSVILVPTNRAKEVRVFHKSFPDFLQDPDRCQDPNFRIDCQTHHGGMALSCLRLVGKLQINPCGLPPFVMNEDVSDRPKRMEKLGSGLRYACKYWSKHFFSSSGEYNDRLIASTSLFFDHTIFPWMEVMSLEGHLEDVIHSMNHLLDWLNKVRIKYDSLRDLINDCLRFTLHFFRPIQLSAQHIYHTALPLSPETSILRSRFFEIHPSLKEDWTTRQTSSSSVPTTWGPILRIIETDSASFTYVAVAGERIVAVCEDNTVNVYDAVTGVLRFSLNPPETITKVESSPDGSVLFFAHLHDQKITVWDTQTGGLVHTFYTTFEIRDIAVSSGGKYLGSCSFGGTFEFLEVESRCGGSCSSGQPIVFICWLEPENQVALVHQKAALIFEVTTGRTLHTCRLGGGQCRGVVFSARQHQLAVSLEQPTGTRIAIIDTRTGAVLKLLDTLPNVSCFTFSENGSDVICATHSGHLLLCNPRFLLGWNHHLSYLGRTHSMNPLRGGHLVVSSKECIQLLRLEYTRPSRANRGPEIVHVYQLKADEAIYGSSRDRRDINLLDMGSMRTLAHRHTGSIGRGTSPFTPRFLCAPIDRKIAIVSFREHGGFALEQYQLRYTRPIWRKPLSRPALLGSLSPSGKYLVTISGGEDTSGGGNLELCVRGGLSGDVLDVIPFIQILGKPIEIAFTSEKQFYAEGCWVFSISEGQPHTEVYDEESRVRRNFSLETVGSRLQIKEVSGGEVLPVLHPYSLDEDLEWVMDTKSRRVCWLPPGYVTGIKDGHFFDGSSIVTAGDDGVVRKLTFREPRSDS